MEEVEEVEVEETTGELSEEHPQEDQLENPNPPEPEIETEIMVNQQPVKPTEETKLDSLMRMMMEQMNRLESDKEERKRDKEELNKKLESDKEDLNKKLESLQMGMNQKLDQNGEELKKQMQVIQVSQEALEKKSEELKKQIKKDLEIVSKKKMCIRDRM